MCDMDAQRAIELAEKSLNGTISPLEQEDLTRWYNMLGRDKDVIILEDQAENEDQLRTKIWLDIANSAHLSLEPTSTVITSGKSNPVISIRRNSWLRYAAAVIILVGSAAIAFVISSNWQPGNSKFDLAKTTTANIQPGKETAILTLADGSTIVLDSASNGTLAQQGNTSIVQLSNGQVAYNLKGASAGPVLMNMMTTPRGGKYQVVLPDGTKAWLNAASSITYPTAFTGTKRNITISGEIYLEMHWWLTSANIQYINPPCGL